MNSRRPLSGAIEDNLLLEHARGPRVRRGKNALFGIADHNGSQRPESHLMRA